LRVLYFPIYETGYQRLQKVGKRGLREAFGRVGDVLEVDYVNEPFDIETLMRAFRPDVLFTQVHGIDKLTTAHIKAARAASPDTLVVNWIGDVWRRCYLEGGMAEYHSLCDLVLGVNADVLAEVETLTGTPARYWQVSFEQATDYPLAETDDLVFLGSAYHPKRTALGEVLQAFGAVVHGSGWTFPTVTNSTYNFQAARLAYQSAKLAISDDSHDARGFVSDRIFSALAAGGAMLLQERIRGLDELTGLRAGVHYIEYVGFDDLREKITYWLDPKRDKKRRAIAATARDYVREHHSFDARVRELWSIIGGLT
jgi:glycosyltransferase involved in cell wall biosynthesis